MSWTVATCEFNLYLWPNTELQMSHLNFFLPSWTIFTCLLKLLFSPKLAVQISYLNCFFLHELHAICIYTQTTLSYKISIANVKLVLSLPSWIIAIWTFILYFDLNSALQMSHLNCFFPSYIMNWCNMFFYAMFWCKHSITNLTFVYFLHEQMKNVYWAWCVCKLPFCPKLVLMYILQISQLILILLHGLVL